MILLAAGSAGLRLDLRRQLPLDVFRTSARTVTWSPRLEVWPGRGRDSGVSVEWVLNGSPGVRRVRSVSALASRSSGWNSAGGRTSTRSPGRLRASPGGSAPASVDPPQLGPISSVMGEITFIALTSKTIPPMHCACWLRRSCAAPAVGAGISQVVPIGGDVREYQVEADPTALAQRGISVDDLTKLWDRRAAARRPASTSTAGRSTWSAGSAAPTAPPTSRAPSSRWKAGCRF